MKTPSLTIPRYREIHETLRSRIVSGEWPPGHRLPSEPELARQFGVARMTVSKAIGALADRGLVTRRRRAGTLVSTPRQQESVLEIHDIEAEVIAAGHAYRYESLARETRAANVLDAAQLQVRLGTALLALEGIHHADGKPHALERRLINLESVPQARRARFTAVSPGRWLLTHVPWTEAEHEISALNADAAIARQLQIARQTACLCIERRTRADERRITYVRLIYPCDQHRLIARFRPQR